MFLGSSKLNLLLLISLASIQNENYLSNTHVERKRKRERERERERERTTYPSTLLFLTCNTSQCCWKVLVA
jgi:hypothetical protein